jgi:hypothetical protein
MGQQSKGGRWHQSECQPFFSAEAMEPRRLLAGARVVVNDVYGVEGDSGTTDFVFEIRRFSVVGSGSVRWTTQDAGAKAGKDYIAASGKVTFRPHERVKRVTVKVIGDTKREYSEWFRLDLYNPVGLKIPDPYSAGLGNIGNDDGDPEAHIQLPSGGFTSVNESNGSVGFAVYKTGNPAKSVSINYTTAEYPEAPSYTARAGVDFVRTRGTLTLGPGVMSKTIKIPLIDDSVPEADKHFKFIFYDDYSGRDSHNSAASVSHDIGYPPTQHVQINDDDPPTVSLDVDPYVRLDQLGRPVVRFTATQPAESTLDATFEFSTADGSATAETDYMALHGTMHMDGGSVPKYIDVPVLTSQEGSPPRDFTFSISNITNGIAANTALTGRIQFDREAPTATSEIVGFVHATNLRANVTVEDNFRMLASSFQSDSIFLSGPNDYRANCFFRIDANLVDAPQEHIPCDFTAPGGTWDATDDGYYTINASGSQMIVDIAGNRLPGGIIGAFEVLGGHLQQLGFAAIDIAHDEELV